MRRTISRITSRDSIGIFVCGSGGCSCSGQGSCEALAEEDGELSLGHAPLTRRHGPLFFRPVQDQEQQHPALKHAATTGGLFQSWPAAPYPLVCPIPRKTP